MKVKDLPEEIQDLVRLRHQQQHGKWRLLKDKILSSQHTLMWENTPEGYHFWEEINRRKYISFYKMYTNRLKIGDPVEIKRDCIEYYWMKEYSWVIEEIMLLSVTKKVGDEYVVFKLRCSDEASHSINLKLENIKLKEDKISKPRYSPMKIKDLPEEIQQLIKIRREHQGRDKNTDISNYSVGMAIHWDGSPEGFTFWDKIRKGNLDPFYEMYTNGFEIEDSVEVISNRKPGVRWKIKKIEINERGYNNINRVYPIITVENHGGELRVGPASLKEYKESSNQKNQKHEQKEENNQTSRGMYIRGIVPNVRRGTRRSGSGIQITSSSSRARICKSRNSKAAIFC